MSALPVRSDAKTPSAWCSPQGVIGPLPENLSVGAHERQCLAGTSRTGASRPVWHKPPPPLARRSALHKQQIWGNGSRGLAKAQSLSQSLSSQSPIGIADRPAPCFGLSGLLGERRLVCNGAPLGFGWDADHGPLLPAFWPQVYAHSWYRRRVLLWRQA